MQQINSYELANQGFVKIPAVLSSIEVQEYIEALEQIIADEQNADVCRELNQQHSIASGIDCLSRQQHPELLKLNAHPVIQSIMHQVYDEEYTIIQDFAVTKMQGGSNQVNWHRDIHPQRWDKNYMLGIYLHDSDNEEGALRIIPNSHKSDLGICELQSLSDINIPMKAGDILLHDMRLAHCSFGLKSWNKRYVMYLEASTSKYAKATYGDELIKSRKLLKQRSVEANKGNYQTLTNEDREQIFGRQFIPLPSLYCFNGINLHTN